MNPILKALLKFCTNENLFKLINFAQTLPQFCPGSSNLPKSNQFCPIKFLLEDAAALLASPTPLTLETTINGSWKLLGKQKQTSE